LSNEPPVDLARISSKVRIEMRMYSEANVSGFAHHDPDVCFFTQVAAILRESDFVLDFGAGRGEWFHDDPVRYRRWIQNLRGRCAHVDGCDVDPAVLGNPTLDAAAVISPGARLPYEDDRFELVISRYVFEHIQDPDWAASELLRVTKPGGWICAITPNRTGYVALAASMVPNRLHARALGSIQPHRKQQDVFPTAYQLNTPGAIRRHFGAGADVFYYRESGIPAYHFGRAPIFRLQQFLHWLLPSSLSTALFLFLRKKSSGSRSVAEGGGAIPGQPA
jgi:SAM-dependent methyltransferase